MTPFKKYQHESEKTHKVTREKAPPVSMASVAILAHTPLP